MQNLRPKRSSIINNLKFKQVKKTTTKKATKKVACLIPENEILLAAMYFAVGDSGMDSEFERAGFDIVDTYSKIDYDYQQELGQGLRPELDSWAKQIRNPKTTKEAKVHLEMWQEGQAWLKSEALKWLKNYEKCKTKSKWSDSRAKKIKEAYLK
jgi:hypothetical protein